MSGYLIDLSSWARSSHAGAADRWADMLGNDELLCHPVFALELLHNSITTGDYHLIRRDLEDAFRWCRPDSRTTELALDLQESMANSAACGQRVKTADLLIAALAVQHDVGVLHYDADYDLIATHGGHRLVSEWIAPRGTLDAPGASPRILHPGIDYKGSASWSAAAVSSSRSRPETPTPSRRTGRAGA